MAPNIGIPVYHSTKGFEKTVHIYRCMFLYLKFRIACTVLCDSIDGAV